MDVNVLIDKLNDMPADDIAAFVKAENITGRTLCARSCVIANLFHKLTGEKVYMSVIYYHHGEEEIETSENVRQFVRDFDHAIYPELICTGS